MKVILLNSMICMLIPIFIYFLSYYLYLREYKNRHKMLAFECGFDSFFNARIPFSTRFFLLAVIFIVFDIEIVLLFPIPMLVNLNLLNLMVFLFIFFFIFWSLTWMKWGGFSLNEMKN
uniref:NADH dehydrogenase subunit 3 n=1 Tax=Haemadipsa hainana TaxID=909595 RepID=UPI0030E15C5D